VDRVPLSDVRDLMAPDGSEVRLLVAGERGGMAHFRLLPGEVSIAKQHRTVEELWYFVAGIGEMCVGADVTNVGPGVSLRIPPRTRFQFRCRGDGPLDAVAVTMPPWPGPEEALDDEPFW
jgi:mannose-6-phosphate isomerase-like protein (cupin superfamily)